MYEPLVSIIIPVYNGSNYLSEAIDSALAQSYSNIEIIVVNDGSDDGGATESIALSYGNKIKYFYKDNGGVSTALNFGIEKMTGEWFSWLSHDDYYMPNKIKSAIGILNANKFNIEKTIISCKSSLINANGEAIFHPKKFHTGFFSGQEMYKNLFNGRILSGCALLIPKKALLEVGGFPAEYKYIQDWVCWIIMAYKGYEFYLYNDNLIKSRVHGNQGQMKIAYLYPIERLDFLNKLFDELNKNAKENSYYIKTVLFNECTKLKNNNLRKKYISFLKENHMFSNLDKIKFAFLLLRGQFIRISKKIYRFVINRKFRGA
jgi:glycosyltransferase involved in cell wall biosynthesis